MCLIMGAGPLWSQGGHPGSSRAAALPPLLAADEVSRAELAEDSDVSYFAALQFSKCGLCRRWKTLREHLQTQRGGAEYC